MVIAFLAGCVVTFVLLWLTGWIRTLEQWRMLRKYDRLLKALEVNILPTNQLISDEFAEEVRAEAEKEKEASE
jgi:hypothetical protein